MYNKWSPHGQPLARSEGTGRNEGLIQLRFGDQKKTGTNEGLIQLHFGNQKTPARMKEVQATLVSGALQYTYTSIR